MISLQPEAQHENWDHFFDGSKNHMNGIKNLKALNMGYVVKLD